MRVERVGRPDSGGDDGVMSDEARETDHESHPAHQRDRQGRWQAQPLDMVLEIDSVDDEALARQQAAAIRDVLEWIHNHRNQHGDGPTEP